jgi:hypothetical protein
VLSNGQRIPIDRITDGNFSRSTVLITTGTISVDVELMAAGQTRISSGVATLIVDELPTIANVMFRLDPQDVRNLYMSWQVAGAPVAHFEVQYGTSGVVLDQKVEVEGTEMVFKGIDPKQDYFFQITPLLGEEKEHGSPTEIYTYSPAIPLEQNTGMVLTGIATTGTAVIIDMPASVPTCSIKGIRVITQKIGGNYYLVWDKVKYATSYTLYMSDVDDPLTKKKLLDTTDTQYEYPFDHTAEQNQYAYFRVEATCDDGQVMELAGAKKVQVGPAEDILLLIFVSLLIYAGIKMYRYAE